jgi:hypothetical protein
MYLRTITVSKPIVCETSKKYNPGPESPGKPKLQIKLGMVKLDLIGIKVEDEAR